MYFEFRAPLPRPAPLSFHLVVRSSHLLWISSSSGNGARSLMLAGYFFAKTAMDSLAQS